MSRSTLSANSHAATESGVPLSDERVAGLRGMLEQQRAFRIEQLAQLHRVGAPGPLGSTNQEVFTSLVAGARAALRDVQNALWRIEEGRYGRCTSCGTPVGLARLEVLPQAALCMPCQPRSEPN